MLLCCSVMATHFCMDHSTTFPSYFSSFSAYYHMVHLKVRQDGGIDATWSIYNLFKTPHLGERDCHLCCPRPLSSLGSLQLQLASSAMKGPDTTLPSAPDILLHHCQPGILSWDYLCQIVQGSLHKRVYSSAFPRLHLSPMMRSALLSSCCSSASAWEPISLARRHASSARFWASSASLMASLASCLACASQSQTPQQHFPFVSHLLRFSLTCCKRGNGPPRIRGDHSVSAPQFLMPAGLVDVSEPVTSAAVSLMAFMACQMACLAS